MQDETDLASGWETLELGTAVEDASTTTPRAEVDAKDDTVESVYRQFIVDVPRMDVVFGDQPWSGHPTLLFMDLWQRLREQNSSKRRAARVIRLCSQSELVSWFIMGQKRWMEGSEHEAHFLDGGRQRTEIHLGKDPPHAVQSITITKPFRVVDFNGPAAPKERFRVRLTLTHDLSADTTTYAWTRKEGQGADWVFVEACAEQPLLSSQERRDRDEEEK
ncbi:Hypothetical Protein FCC1311_041832 [Hondaea fermentalgiana]|uniref:Uncharacterized protein n=1 Tax=Hondaea fermentalgiana TaxID=2315210 RepID=A0A2R5GAB9_9STRA|nr:Hypothetical Protein FCC1311_041832 [Hondaea fermentalgiana]|eukprot:GBG27960.1 Hypothetical Protein FCC1311_041832 [Hondaea fermentalgiana]